MLLPPRLIAAALATGAATLLSLASALAAPPGALDASFGGDGVVTTAFDPLGAGAASVIQLASGKLLVAGYVDAVSPATNEKRLLLARYNAADGALDSGFSGDGVRLVSMASGLRATAVAEQADRKLVTTGWVRNDTGDHLALVRVKADGSADGGFGTDGVATVTGVDAPNERGYAVLPNLDGTVFAGGYRTSNTGNGDDFLLTRFSNKGAVDTGYGVSGSVLVDFAKSHDRAYTGLRDASGRMVLAGQAILTVDGVSSAAFALARFTATGKLDNSFSSDGKVTTGFAVGDYAVALALAQQKDGKLVAAGYNYTVAGSDIAVARYLGNGQPDTSFSTDGKVLVDFGGADDVANGVIQQFDGKLLVSGVSNYRPVLVRFNADGTLDTTFGNGTGKLVIGHSNPIVINGLVQQADGQAVAAGAMAVSSVWRVALLRYLFDDDDADGVIDTADNCQFVANADQVDTDGDDQGDACDADDDNDGVPDTADAFPLDPAESVDTDGDGIGNNADPDDDDDGVPDVDDPFPLDPFRLDQFGGVNKGDSAGYSVAMLSDVDGDGHADVLVGAPKHAVVLAGSAKPAAAVGSVYLKSGKTLALIATLDGEARGDEFGSAVAALGDLDGDGVADFAVGAPKADDVASGKVTVKDRGAVYVYSGATRALLFRLTGAAAGDGFGVAVAAAGDLDGDSVPDMLVGAWLADAAGKDSGAAYLYDGASHTLLQTFPGEAAGDAFGYSLTGAADMDHDGIADISVGAYRHDPLDAASGKLRKDAGSVYLYRGVAPYAPLARLDGQAKGDNFGFALAAVPSGSNGFVNLLVGAPRADVSSGGLRKDAGLVALYADTSAPLYRVSAPVVQAGALFGYALAGAGDVDSVSGDEWVAGAPGMDIAGAEKPALKDAGQVLVFHAGSGAGVFRIDGAAKGGRYGFAVAGGADHNADNHDDVLVGAPLAKSGSKAKAGLAEVISGKEASAAALPEGGL